MLYNFIHNRQAECSHLFIIHFSIYMPIIIMIRSVMMVKDTHNTTYC